MNKTRIIALILAAAIAVSACALLAGCKKNDTDPTAATTATTATTAATTAATTGSNANNNNNSANNNGSQSQGTSSQAGGDTAATIDAEGYISQDVAVANVRQQVGTGAQIISVEKGYSPDGAAAWVVVVQPITKDDGPATVTYYSGYLFCYPDTGSSSEQADQGHGIHDAYFANVSEQDAGLIALNNIGDGWRITSTYQSSYQGVDAWAIVVTNDATGQTRTAYVNGSDCYFG